MDHEGMEHGKARVAGTGKAASPAHAAHDGMGGGMYGRLALMLLVSFVAMYALMYAMVDRFENVYASWNQVWMAGLMAAPMALIELALMGGMYPDKRRNAIVVVLALLVMGLCWMGIRRQVGIGDAQFARSMIPHHAGAVLMCQQNRLTDPELQALCRDIIASQQAEIALMRTHLR